MVSPISKIFSRLTGKTSVRMGLFGRIITTVEVEKQRVTLPMGRIIGESWFEWRDAKKTDFTVRNELIQKPFPKLGRPPIKVADEKSTLTPQDKTKIIEDFKTKILPLDEEFSKFIRDNWVDLL